MLETASSQMQVVFFAKYIPDAIERDLQYSGAKEMTEWFPHLSCPKKNTRDSFLWIICGYKTYKFYSGHLQCVCMTFAICCMTFDLFVERYRNFNQWFYSDSSLYASSSWLLVVENSQQQGTIRWLAITPNCTFSGKDALRSDCNLWVHWAANWIVV